MSNVGALRAKLDEGSRSEYGARYVCAWCNTAIFTRRQEDTGVDLY
jgi:hypothetical protein